MKLFRSAVTAAALVLTLPGAQCMQSLAVDNAGTLAASVMSPSDLANAQKLCAAAAPALSAATASANSTVANTAVYPKAWCDQLAAMPAGQVPATTTSTTYTWLLTAIQAAGIILPLVL